MIALAAIPVLIWLYLLVGRGGFWRIAKNLAPLNFSPVPAPRVVAVIPARNEAAVIRQALQSLRPQTFAIVVVDDNSEDATAETAKAAGVAGSTRFYSSCRMDGETLGAFTRRGRSAEA